MDELTYCSILINKQKIKICLKNHLENFKNKIVKLLNWMNVKYHRSKTIKIDSGVFETSEIQVFCIYIS